MLNPKILSISSLFQESDVYDIPSYQRDYKWGELEVSTLIKDLIEFKKAFIEKNDKNFMYYLGNIITQKTASGSIFSNNADHYLIDGQQRMTTFFLINKYIILRKKEFYDEKEFIYEDEIKRAFFKSQGNKFKLINKNKSLEVFMKSTTPSDNDLLYRNYELIDTLLHRELSSKKLIEEWEIMMKNIVFGVMEVSLSQNAEEIFENINSKGKFLSFSEKLKNKFLLMNNLIMKKTFDGLEIDDSHKENNENLEKKIIEVFDDIEKIQSDIENKSPNIKFLGISESSDFLRAICSHVFKTEVRKGESAYNSIKNIVSDISDFTELEKTIDLLIKDLNIFKKILALFSHGDQSSSFKMKWILIKSISFLPLIIQKLNQTQIHNEIINSDNKTLMESINLEIDSLFKIIAKSSILTDGFKGINLWRINYKAIDFLTNENSEIYSLYISDDKSNEDIEEVDNQQISIDKIINNQIYKTDKLLAKLLLLMIEKDMEKDGGAHENIVNDKYIYDKLTDKTFTIEHIIPQTINASKEEGKHWISVFEDDSFNFEDAKHKLGNLTISQDKMNKQMKNNTFTKKKEFFSSSRLLLNKEIAKESEFNAAVFKQRSNLLASKVFDLLS